MPQMPIIQPALPKGQPQTKKTGATGDQKQNTFSPQLDQAVSRNKKQQADDSRVIVPAKKNDDNSAALNRPVKQSTDPEKSPKLEPEESPDILGTADTGSLTDIVKEKSVQVSLGVAEHKETALLSKQQIEPSAQQAQNTAIGGTGKLIPPKTLSVAIPPANIEPAAADHGTQPTAVKTQNILLDQLQHIIDQSDEAGIVSITKTKDVTLGNSMRSNFHGVFVPTAPENSTQVVAAKPIETSAAAATGILIVDSEGSGKAITPEPKQVTAGSHEARQQYFNPKIATPESGDPRQNFQDHPQGDQLSQQTPGSGPQNGLSSGLSSSVEQGNTFSQIITPTQQPTSQVADAAERPILLPSGMIVQEDDIIQQLSHRMQLSGKNMDTRINLRLHPAELGSLKIDLTVKEGSIRANVVAQSQHTTELLEKNLAKLKTVLENQGYSVDEISITTESESVSDFNLFDQQLFNHNDDTSKPAKTNKDTESVFTLADTLFAAPAINTGINVKI